MFALIVAAIKIAYIVLHLYYYNLNTLQQKVPKSQTASFEKTAVKVLIRI